MGKRGPRAITLEEAWAKLLARAKLTDTGCLLIEGGATVGIGYKYVRANNEDWYAHHIADFIARGPAPVGTIRRHTCDHPNCIRPSHIIRGTHADNVADKVSRERQPRGTSHINSMLTAEQVREILHSPYNYAQLAAQYCISRGAIHNIKSGRSWNSVTGLPKKK